MTTTGTFPNSWTARDILTAAIRLLFGGMLIYAASDKIVDPEAFAKAVWNYKIFSREISLAVATVLPWMEALSGAGIMLGVLHRGSALLALTMMLAFTGGVISGMARGLDISCGCFSLDPEVGKIGWMKLVENGGLIAAAAFLFLTNSTRGMLAALWKREPIPEEIPPV